MGVPKKSKIFWGKEEQGSVRSFCRGQKRRGADMESSLSAFFRFLQSAGAISCAFASTTLLSSASGRSAVK